MDRINLQAKTVALEGRIESYWFENKYIDLPLTLFHRIYIPLKEFDSGLDWEEQPLSTQIVFEWYDLKLVEPEMLDGLNLSSKNYPSAEATVYVGSAHNWCDVISLQVKEEQLNHFWMSGSLDINFENEGVAMNEKYSFETTAVYSKSKA